MFFFFFIMFLADRKLNVTHLCPTKLKKPVLRIYCSVAREEKVLIQIFWKVYNQLNSTEAIEYNP
jgi:hypothetical protein